MVCDTRTCQKTLSNESMKAWTVVSWTTHLRTMMPPRSKWIIGADNYCYGHSYSALLEQLEDVEDDFPKYIRDHEDVVLGIFATPHVY